MIYTKLNEAEIFKGATNKTYEYNINDNDINYCVVEIDGRFPKEKWAVNRKCKEMAHILSGSGILVVEDKEYHLKQDDVVLIDINEKYQGVVKEESIDKVIEGLRRRKGR